MQIRNATENDAQYLAELINLAGEGIPVYLWRQMKEDGQSALEFGAIRAAREEGGFSYTHAWVAEQQRQVAAMVLGYKLPDPYELNDIDESPEFIRPIIELEARAPGSWYINALATFEAFRGQGIGAGLISFVEGIAKGLGCTNLSLIVASGNTGAKRLYQNLGFLSQASKPIASFPGFEQSGDWVLMIKDI